MPHALKLAAVAAGEDFKRISNHSLRSGGASLMFTAGCDMEIIKRWGSAGVRDIPPVPLAR